MEDVIKQKMRMVNVAGCGAVVLLIAGTITFGVVPMFKSGTQNIVDAARLQSQLSALDGLRTTVEQVEEQRKQTENRLKDIERRLPSSSETNTFIKELARVTQAAGIQVEGTTYPRDLKDAGGYKSLPVEVVGTGDWDSCYKFLTGLRSMDRITRLDSLSLELDKKNGEDGRPLCKMTVNFSTFFMVR